MREADEKEPSARETSVRQAEIYVIRRETGRYKETHVQGLKMDEVIGPKPSQQVLRKAIKM